MKSIRFRFLVAALAVLFGTVIAKSQTADAPPPPPVHGAGFGMGDHMLKFFTEELNLTDAQQEQAHAILAKEMPTIKPLMQQSRQMEQQLHQFAEGSYDETKVRNLATQKAQVELELSVQRTRIHSELYQLLTPDQQSKLKQLEADQQARMQRHMRPGPPPPPAEE
ncbi:MAG TPA: Spy/CpxP family protein refolding chaperone [Candidatus Sulfotelmatobacter sp.]|nr:Spy/CpxP family protein refolding chaperone [Candidatus Sulfotelmatobacter sp.]